MEIHCPHCAHPIPMPDDICSQDGTQSLLGITSINCPNCGSVSLADNLEKTATFLPELDENQNRRIGHFALKKRLGGGGFGTVWLAEDLSLGRQVALKLPASEGHDAANLLYEAKTAASLRHPNIVSIYEVETENGRPYIASEYIDGLTLRDFLTTGRPPIPRTVELLIGVAQALQHAHEHGVVHRDIKPANIILNKQGQPFVADFGIAKRISANATISSEGQVVGTARYMSPEQASGKTRETDHRSDIYALGVLLFELMTGETPFRGNVRALLHQKMFEEAPSPRKLDPTLPKDLETICLKCLEREPTKRYQTAQAVIDELQRFRAGDPIQARPISAAERLWRRCRRHPVVSLLTLLLFLSLTLGFLGVSVFYLDAKRNAEQTQRSLYRAQMNLAASFLDNGDIAGVRRALRRFGADTPFAKLRGFEWFYFDAVASRIIEVANQGEPILDVAASRDGKLCATCGKDGLLRVWESKSGKLFRKLSLNAHEFQAVSFASTSDQLATGATDGWVRIWNPLQDDQLVQEFKHGPRISLVRFAPNGIRLLSAGPSGAVRIWEIGKESPIAEIPAGEKGMKDARFSPDGEHVAIAGGDGMIRVWNIGTRMIVHRLSLNLLVETIAYSDDGRTIVAGSSNGAVRIWSVADERLEKTYEAIWNIGDMEFLKSSRILAIASIGGDLHLFDVDTHREVTQLSTHTMSAGILDRSADGKLMAVGSGDGAVKLVGIPDQLTPNVYWHESNVRAVEFLATGKQLVSVSLNGALHVSDFTTGIVQEPVPPVGRPLTAVAVQPNGNLFAVGGPSTKVTLWGSSTLKPVETIEATEGGVLTLDFSADGRQLAAATSAGPIAIFDSANWRKPRRDINRPDAKVNALQFSPKGDSIAVAYSDGAVQFFNSSSGNEQGTSIRLAATPLAVCYCEHGNVLAIGTETGEIHLWDLASNRARNVIKGHSGKINALTVMRNGITLISGGLDHDVKLWDTVTGERITVLEGHLRQVHCVAVSPGGETIASGGLEGDLRIWRGR